VETPRGDCITLPSRNHACCGSWRQQPSRVIPEAFRSASPAIALPRRPPDAEEVLSTIPFEHFPVWTPDGSLCPIDIVYMKIDGGPARTVQSFLRMAFSPRCFESMAKPRLKRGIQMGR
jgi:hypothetical protein